MPIRMLLLAFAMVTVTTVTSSAQGVLIAPQAAIIDAQHPTATFTIANPGTEPVEVDVSAIFGYPVTNADGQMILQTIETPADSSPSAARWIEVFPQRMTLAPGARKVVRILVTAPASARDGEYWARLVFTSRQDAKSFAAGGATANVRTALDLEVRTVMPLVFRRGKVQTALTIGEITTARRGDSLVVRPDLRRSGTGAWIGTVRVSLVDIAGTVRASNDFPMGVYYGLSIRLPIAVAGLPAGNYTVRVEGRSQRSDLTASQILPAATVSRSVQVVVP